MKNEKLYDAISDIREEFIEEAENYKFKKSIVPRLVKWGSMAACFCLVVLGAGLVMSGTFAKKGAKSEAESGTAGLAPAETDSLYTVLAYNGALYNVSNNLADLNAAGIPDIMTPEDCGASLGNLRKTENGGYEETVLETDIELYQYASAFSNTAVYVIRDGEEYMAGLYSNHLTIGDDNDHSPISSLYRRYGIKTEEQIASVAEVNSVTEGQVISEVIKEPEEIAEFYEATKTMESLCFGREDFKTLVTNKMAEDEYQAFLQTARFICIETYEGLKFYIKWYPEAGWFYSSGSKAFYQVTEEMQAWLDTYLE